MEHIMVLCFSSTNDFRFSITLKAVNASNPIIIKRKKKEKILYILLNKNYTTIGSLLTCSGFVTK